MLVLYHKLIFSPTMKFMPKVLVGLFVAVPATAKLCRLTEANLAEGMDGKVYLPQLFREAKQSVGAGKM